MPKDSHQELGDINARLAFYENLKEDTFIRYLGKMLEGDVGFGNIGERILSY